MLSFLANLVLAFPVILLFYLLVTPGIMETPIPYAMAGHLLPFPILFLLTLFVTRYCKTPVVTGSTAGRAGRRDRRLDLCRTGVRRRPARHHLDRSERAEHLRRRGVRVQPGVFRIVRGLVMDIKTRDYVAAAQTRGESPWYIMLWEILPNARGPLIVDACLRIGYTTILLGTLGFFGLGLAPESPDWGTAIKDGSAPAQALRASGHHTGAGADELRAGPESARGCPARRVAEGLRSMATSSTTAA